MRHNANPSGPILWPSRSGSLSVASRCTAHMHLLSHANSRGEDAVSTRNGREDQGHGRCLRKTWFKRKFVFPSRCKTNGSCIRNGNAVAYCGTYRMILTLCKDYSRRHSLLLVKYHTHAAWHYCRASSTDTGAGTRWEDCRSCNTRRQVRFAMQTICNTTTYGGGVL